MLKSYVENIEKILFRPRVMMVILNDFVVTQCFLHSSSVVSFEKKHQQICYFSIVNSSNIKLNISYDTILVCVRLWNSLRISDFSREPVSKIIKISKVIINFFVIDTFFMWKTSHKIGVD